ncbi:MAG: InlB B-repeat-containing protein [Anaerolineales bacterium]|nr:InlB B-repeat-containing protein [Anaerolineales bacterium]
MTPQVANVPTALTLNTFIRTGYTFAGWNTLANGTGINYADGALYSFEADITLYAKWTTLPTHTVTFNANGGIGTMTPQAANVPTALALNTFTAQATPSRAGTPSPMARHELR